VIRIFLRSRRKFSNGSDSPRLWTISRKVVRRFPSSGYQDRQVTSSASMNSVATAWRQKMYSFR
jgi:hypothetical protein